VLAVGAIGLAYASHRSSTLPELRGVASGDARIPFAKSAKHKGPRPATAYPKSDPSQPGATKWTKYPADEVLPYGIGIGVCDGVIVGVMSTDPKHPDYELMCTRYVVGDLDASDITMPLWRRLDLEMPKPDGSVSELSVARPLWWIQETGAKVGETIDLGMQEIGISGEAKVLRIGPCDADSRDNEDGTQIVTGTIKHRNAEVWDLVFNNDTKKPLGVTANHPIMSADRNDWLPAGELRLNENVQTIDGTATLTAKSKRPGRETVYNLEVHRSHAYHVSQFGILAHNSNVLQCGQIAAEVTRRFPIGKCDECATTLIGRLKAAGIKGQRIEIRGGHDFIVSATHGAQEAISRNGRHVGVRVGEMVYDNIHPNGLPFSQWLKDFDAAGGIRIHEILDF
jgi:hypothetical protein